MELKPYPKYKDLGILGIGKIPEGWEVKRLRFNALVNPSGKNALSNPKTLVNFLPMEKVSENGEYELESEAEYQDVSTGYTYFEDNDVLVAKITPCFENGKGALVNNLKFGFGFGTTEFHVIRSYSQLMPKYLFYLTKTHLFRVSGEAFMEGAAGQKRVSTDFIKDFMMATPPLPDQTAIASFLDKRTVRFDALIEKDKRLIELLKEKRTALINHAVTKGLDPDVKLKDSGIPWIGKIPEDAKIMPFRRVCYVNQGLQFPEDERLSEPDEKSKIYITIKYIHADEDGVKEYIPNPPRSVICKKEDVLLARTGATGEVITNQEGVFHNNFFKVNYNSKIDRDYLVYYLKMDSIKKVLLLKAGVTTIPDLNHDAFLSTPFILYSIEKQKQIAGYLDKKNAKIDKTIKLIEKKINLLEEYKKSLIHYVVTGKVDIRKMN